MILAEFQYSKTRRPFTSRTHQIVFTWFSGERFSTLVSSIRNTSPVKFSKPTISIARDFLIQYMKTLNQVRQCICNFIYLHKSVFMMPVSQHGPGLTNICLSCPVHRYIARKIYDQTRSVIRKGLLLN
jgi:hypothetical protein